MSKPASNTAGAPCVNLVPASRRKAMHLRARLRRWVLIVPCYAALVVAGSLAYVTVMANDREDLGATLDKTGRHVEELTRTLTSLRPQLVEVRTRLAVARIVGQQPDWSELMSLIGRAMDDEMVLSGASVEANANGDDANNGARQGQVNGSTRLSGTGLVLTLRGFAPSQPSVAQFILRLERLGLFDRVTLLHSARQQIEAGEVTAFRAECVIGLPSAAPVTPAASASTSDGGAGR